MTKLCAQPMIHPMSRSYAFLNFLKKCGRESRHCTTAVRQFSLATSMGVLLAYIVKVKENYITSGSISSYHLVTHKVSPLSFHFVFGFQ